MNKKAYDAIKMQIHEEKQEVELEIGKLQGKKMLNSVTRKNEMMKLSFVSKMFAENKTVSAGSLHQNFKADLVKQLDKENELLDGFIKEQYVELEKLKEKEKEVDSIFKIQIDIEKKKALKKQEMVLLEYKKLKNRK